MALHTESRMILHSSDRALEKGFDLLRHEALSWVFEGYPVGDYYEAALPGRDAFCMRDTSHQCLGAEALGLHSHNKNMLRKFAQYISEKRDYCSYWEIDRYDRPCPVDYDNDASFWYNLPANYDVLDAVWRMYRYSGDREYLTDPAFEKFGAWTVENYTRFWDRDGDGIPDRILSEGRRGIASYDESAFGKERMKAGTDLVCIMARAYMSYSDICRVTGRSEEAAIYRRKGEALKELLNTVWYTPKSGYAAGLGFDGKPLFFHTDCSEAVLNVQDALYRGIAEGDKAERCLNVIELEKDKVIIELFSHFPEILYKYGRDSAGMEALRRAMDEKLERRSYPEASFSAIGAISGGLMGVEPDAEFNMVTTRSHLWGVEWVDLEHVCALDGSVSVEHAGKTRTEFKNECAHPITWRAAFSEGGTVYVNGKQAQTQPENGVCFADVTLTAGESASAECR